MLALVGAATLTGHVYKDGTRNVAALLFCGVMGFCGPIVGLIVFAPVTQAAWNSLWSGAAFSLPGLVSMRGEFLVSGWFIGTIITLTPALLVARRDQK